MYAVEACFLRDELPFSVALFNVPYHVLGHLCVWNGKPMFFLFFLMEFTVQNKLHVNFILQVSVILVITNLYSYRFSFQKQICVALPFSLPKTAFPSKFFIFFLFYLIDLTFIDVFYMINRKRPLIFKPSC